MIDVLNMMAEGEIEYGTKLIVIDERDERDERNEFIYDDYKNGIFIDDGALDMNAYYFLDYEFLDYEVELIPPKEKKYLIKINIKGLIRELTVVNYQRLIGEITLGSPGDTNFVQTSFTKSEMQSIEPIRKFLAYMKGDYELIEVEENEID